MPMLRRLAAIGLLALPCLHGGPARAQLSIVPNQVATDVSISWEVHNRFRLFRDEKDFNRHLAAESGRTILAAEQTLAQETDGRGWARDMVTRLCVDGAGRVLDTCVRDGTRESYLDPVDHRVTVRLAGAVPTDASCAWSFDNGEGAPQTLTVGCGEEVNLRALYGRTTKVTVDITAGGATRRTSDAIEVRDLRKVYPGDVEAVKGISFDVAPGEIFGLLGPNGAGKSTLMPILATLQKADSGTVTLETLDVLRQKEEVRKILGYLPQDFGVYPKISALDMLDHLALLKGFVRAAEESLLAADKQAQTSMTALDIPGYTRVHKSKSTSSPSGGGWRPTIAMSRPYSVMTC